MPGGVDFGFGGPVIARPCLGGERRELGNVEPNDRARRAMNQSGALGSLRWRSQPQANRSDARPACPHYPKPLLAPVQVARRSQVPLMEHAFSAGPREN